MSIEVDPRTVDTRQLEHLRSLGFNRVSLGVQDFHEKVQKAVDRIQPYDQVERLVTAGKNLGFLSVNFDLIYGLPYQTRETYEHTLDKVIELRPGRIAMYNFAYLPKSMPFQRRLDPESLPNPDEKLAIFMLARERLGKAGYQYIGLDHFALNEDDLSVSYRDGSMRRNFMGYTTQAGTDLLAFGVSGITEFQGKFWQNEKKLNRYEQIINDGHLPIIRGMELSPDDLMRKSLISALFCESGFDFAAMAEKFDPKLRELLEYEVQALKPLQEDGLVELSDKGIRVTVDGQLFLRNIAVLFDNHLRSRERPAQFSRTV
ncbi:MAG: oxygen-independent coproporphyrinogen III oxidase [Deltaproteobacteria bacterium]|nr:oxygen-independent coproporphyrinogen III oxidase [Deltaproteobacteria bacterium]